MSDSTTERPTRALTKGPLSARRGPLWLNQATVKGATLVLAGAAMMVLTSDSDNAVTVILGLALAGWAASELWFRIVRKGAPRDFAGLAFSLTLLVGGVVLIVDPGPALSVLVGITLLVRGVVMLVGLARSSPSVPGAPARSALLIVAGVAMILIPEAFFLGIRAIAGGAAMVIGAILMMLGLEPKDDETALDIDLRGAGHLAEEWLRDRRLEPARTEEISDGLFFEQPRRAAKLASFWIMMSLATAIATFAVIQNSTAVVIGAMLVAPLMTPIMGIAAGMVNGWAVRTISSLVIAVSAAAIAILLAWLIAAWLPSVGNLATNPQITSRTSPNLLDLCVAVAAGAAGAYAIVDPRVSSSLSGVAIAVALVPPLAVVGITLEAGSGGDALGALLLFLTNFVSIILAGSLVLFLTGYARFPRSAADRAQQWRFLGPVLIGAVLIVVPLGLTSIGIWNDASNTATAQDVVDEWLGDDRDLSTVRVEADGNDVEVVLTGSGTVPDVTKLETELDAQLDTNVELTLRMIPSQLLSP
jgi:uncharacterized hydrophobic protein (TIGR00271 family)